MFAPSSCARRKSGAPRILFWGAMARFLSFSPSLPYFLPHPLSDNSPPYFPFPISPFRVSYNPTRSFLLFLLLLQIQLGGLRSVVGSGHNRSWNWFCWILAVKPLPSDEWQQFYWHSWEAVKQVSNYTVKRASMQLQKHR